LGTLPIVAGSNAPCALAVVDDRLVDAGVAAVGDHRLGVLQLAFRVPHLAGVADHRRHRGIDDHVAGHVQVGDALVGVDHRQGGARRILAPDVGLDRLLLSAGSARGGVQVAMPLLASKPSSASASPCLASTVAVELVDTHGRT
jgi:hypothetical protein